jgi:hypothetical protein
MRDLELRLGLASFDAPASVRVPRWTARVAAAADTGAFYERSFQVDPVGTASTLLAWRDALVEAGWNGGIIEAGGDRLRALAVLEAQHDDIAAPGSVDRLVALERALAQTSHRVYDELELIEDRSLWPRRWQSIFDHLERTGTAITPCVTALPGAPEATDLGRLQRLIRGELPPGSVEPKDVRGDGSLLLLCAETPTELAEATASLMSRMAPSSTGLVVRCLDAAPLEAALVRHGLASQGLKSGSVWRPSAQILPLALELAFEPRDPYRVLDLLTLPIGPFQGKLGARLAKAVAGQPGVGGQAWVSQRSRALELLADGRAKALRDEGKSPEEAERLAAKYVDERSQRIVEWLETPGAPMPGAPKDHVLATVARVRAWLQSRLATGNTEVYGGAFAEAQAFAEALSHDPRETLTRDQTRQLLDTVARGAQSCELSPERCGRMAHVNHLSAVLASAPTVIFWGFVSGVERHPPLQPWN